MCCRWFCSIFAVGLCLAVPFLTFPVRHHAVRAGEKASPELGKVFAYLKNHCLHCHGAKRPRGDLSLEAFNDELAILKDRKTWGKVLQMVRGGEMPPESRPRPRIEDSETFIAALQEIFNRADKKAGKDPGRVTMRRLNRTEYNNTIRDLVGVDFDAGEYLPQDDVGYGFDNIGDVLTISPLLMDRYLAAAENIMQRAILPKLPEPNGRKFNAKYLRPNPEFKGGGPRRVYENGRFATPDNYYKVPIAGDYIVRVRCFALNPGADPARIKLEISGKDLKSFTVSQRMSAYDAPVKLDSGAYALAVHFLSAAKDDKSGKKTGLEIQNVELVGPLDTRPASHKKLLAVTPGQDEKHDTREVLTRFAGKAYRRPPTADEIDRLVKFVEQTRARGDSWESSIQLALQAVLCSPKFLFRVELDHTPDNPRPHAIDDYHLASRLSYFLWTSMPDDELFALAAKNQLHQNLEAQVRRMLKDKRAASLMENFGLQWLQLRTLRNFSPDAKLFPEWDEALRKSMLKETELFLAAIQSEDRSILDMIDADFTFLDARLAKHYGIVDSRGNRADQKKKIPGGTPFKGKDFQRVSLQGDERGGLLTHASILAVNSNPTRTSPVKRGRWVLEQILGTPPPPPPPNVPELAEGDKVQTKGTLRQRMEQHRANPNCATCHARMDPIGFAFENFDAIGKFRNKDGDFPIDPSGVLPNGQVFQGPRELKAILKGKKDLFGRCLAEKMLTYALGRGLDYYDKPAVDTILAALDRDNYRFSTLVLEIVKSDPFRLRRGKDQK